MCKYIIQDFTHNITILDNEFIQLMIKIGFDDCVGSVWKVLMIDTR